MITVEEAIAARHMSSGFMLQYRTMLAREDSITFPNGVDDVVQLALTMGQAPLYTWARHIKRVVDESCANYPLHEAIRALHYFHQPCMFWLFDDAVLEIKTPANEHERLRTRWLKDRGASLVDAILIVPYVKGRPKTAQQFIQEAMQQYGASAEDRARMAHELCDRASGVQIIAFSSIRTGIAVPLPIGSAPAGSRLCSPVMIAQIEFGRSPADLDIIDEQLSDPTIEEEQTRLKQWVLAAAALLKQRILVAETQPATRAERKRLDRQELQTSVMTIQLRATEHTTTTTASSVIDWSHRWIVRGHWRQQWYPSQDEHRVVWIPPYIKGPEDLPLMVRPAVYAVSR